MEIAGLIGLLFLTAILGFYIETRSNSKIDGTCIAAILFVLTLLAFAMGNEYDETNIETQNIKQYTYRCKLCDNCEKANEEPKIKICEDCKNFIYELKESEDK